MDGNNEKIYQSMEKCLGRYLNALMEEKQYDEIRTLAEKYGDIVGTAYFILIDGVEYVFDPQVEDNIAKGGYVGYYRFFKTYAEVPDKYRLY